MCLTLHTSQNVLCLGHAWALASARAQAPGPHSGGNGFCLRKPGNQEQAVLFESFLLLK